MSRDAYAGFHPAGAGWVVGCFLGPACVDEKVGAFLSVINDLVLRGLGDLIGRWWASSYSFADLLAFITARKRRERLRRYGVVFRKLLERETGLPPWRELFYMYRRMEARGEIRGGRFVSGFCGGAVCAGGRV